MASFTKRGNTWQYTISRMVNGESKPLRKGGFKTKKEAQVAALEIEVELRKGSVPNLKPVSLVGYFENWLKLYKKDIANNTLERYKNTLRTIIEYFGNRSIQDINKRSYQTFLNQYGKTHAKASTRKLNTHIRACVKEAIDEGLIRIDFTRNAVITGRKGKRPEEKHLDYIESELLLKELYDRIDTCQGSTNYLLLLALTSGMRFGELVGLTRKDFDFINNTISINKSWGYTNKMHEGFGETKNEQSNRIIKMDKKTMKSFYKSFQITPENIYKLVFYSPASKYKVISNNAVNKALENILFKLDIKSISFHGLRHTHASVLLYKGVSIYYVSERLGHGDIETTMNTYTHIVKELREKDEEKTSTIFSSMVV
ncbi:site-specific integrase [Bacillus cereus]|uniref:Site-specific integrase n=1 Tax=Bacillus cereus TaxID=1396 RepID=A0A9X7GWU9_BACCE|nr:site-specific integrase [Bacillus cereus]PGS80537.1 site-specific integrase [Bacillus cereus]